MNMTKEQVGMAVNAGLELFGPKSEVKIPVRMNDSVFLLKQLLVSIAQGKTGLTAVDQKPPAPPPIPAPELATEEKE